MRFEPLKHSFHTLACDVCVGIEIVALCLNGPAGDQGGLPSATLNLNSTKVKHTHDGNDATAKANTRSYIIYETSKSAK
jgi:hypothetical protein